MKNYYARYHNQFTTSFNVILLLVAFTLFSNTTAYSQDLDVPYVPTPEKVVEKMLDMANVQEGDYVIDLGSGDGRIVISAVKRGAYGHGIDLDPDRIKEARENAQSQGLEDQVMFIEGDIFEADFSRASVITMYLLNSVNKKLRPKLLENLEPGTRIVSHSFSMGDWKADKRVEISPESSGGRLHTVYYWVIPARVEGSWTITTEGTNLSVSIEQQYQEIEITPPGNWEVSEAELSGKRISFKLHNGNNTHLYSGRVEEGSVTGMVQKYEGDNHNVVRWSASRN